MKLGNFYRIFLPLLLAFFNVLSSTANSYNYPVPDLDPKNYDYLQEDQNTSALYLEEISNRAVSPVNSKNDLLSGCNFITGVGYCLCNILSDNKLSSIIIRDKKEILKTYIFPFHFFW